VGEVNRRGLRRELSVYTLGIGVTLAESLKGSNGLWEVEKGEKCLKLAHLQVPYPFRGREWSKSW